MNSGPAITVSIPPLHNPLAQETTESEKSARDTLQVLINGSGQFPSIVTSSEGNVNIIAAMSLVSPGIMRCIEQGDVVESGGVRLNKDDSSEESSSRE